MNNFVKAMVWLNGLLHQITISSLQLWIYTLQPFCIVLNKNKPLSLGVFYFW